MGIQDYRSLVWPTGTASPATIADLFEQTSQWLAPEMFFDTSSLQPVYAPAGNPTDYSGATDWAPYFAQMRTTMLSMLLDTEWPDTPTYYTHRAPFGIALQPGKRYRVNSPVNFTDIIARGLLFDGNGGSLVGVFPAATTRANNPITTVNGSAIVTVAHTAHSYVVGQKIKIAGATAVGGLTVNGVQILTATTPNSYTFTFASNASSSATGGGASVTVTKGFGPILDMLASGGWSVRNLRIESDNSNLPDFGVLLGTHVAAGDSGYHTAPVNSFSQCFVDGWFNQSAFYNGGSEQFSWYAGSIQNVYTPPAVWLDSVASIDLSLYSHCAGVTKPVGTEDTMLFHSFNDCEIRNTSASPTGPLYITSTLSNSLLQVNHVRLRSVYLTNNGASGTLHPGFTIKGQVKSFHADLHCELSVPNATIQLSHIGYYDTSAGSVTQYDHKIRDVLSMAEVAAIDKTNDANILTMVDAEIAIGLRHGQNVALAYTPIFGPNMSNANITGKLATQETNSGFLNPGVLASYYGNIFGEQTFSSLALPAKVGGYYFQSGKSPQPLAASTYNATLTATANLTAVAAVEAFHYERSGDIVTVWGRINVTATAAVLTLTTFGISLPIASDLTANGDLVGMGTNGGGNEVVTMISDTTNDRAAVSFYTASNALHQMFFTFRYTVK